MIDLAIRNTHPTVVTIHGERDAWDKDGNVVVLDESKIATELAKLQADYDAKQYQRDRVYPSIGDQLDMQYKDLLNGTTTWKDAVAKVKSDNPKP
jgi:hypothetical protein